MQRHELQTEEEEDPVRASHRSPGMPLQTAAVVWRSLAIQCIKRHYIHSFLELLGVVLLSLATVTTNFASDPTIEPGQRQLVSAMTAWRAHRGRDAWQRLEHPEPGDDYADRPRWPSPLSPEGTDDVLGDDQRHQVPRNPTAATGGDANDTQAVHFGPAIPKYENLIASAFPERELINYTDEYHLAFACSLVEFEACVYFMEGRENELSYRLHYFESDSLGEKGLDIGFRHPEEFHYEPEMDRPLWENYMISRAVGAVYRAQTAINSAFIATKHKPDVNNITVKPFPTPEFPENIKRYRYGLFWLVATVFLHPTWRLLWRLCNENTSGLREYQLLMGLNNCFYWTGHFLCALCFFLVHSAICVYSTAVHKTVETGAPYLDRTDPFLIFVVFLVLSTQQILLTMTISCIFTSGE
ncbi:hypothetical protein V5799_003868 [Amblyomma americanum]|uniref:ABC-2 type transporter transmembrane domain-containing protein n=1 Tax=Amblyomma americanum TaxID=6943 RepID=A0AAQ4D7Q7_AMBAM